MKIAVIETRDGELRCEGIEVTTDEARAIVEIVTAIGESAAKVERARITKGGGLA
jgi:hypothetical protein